MLIAVVAVLVTVSDDGDAYGASISEAAFAVVTVMW